MSILLRPLTPRDLHAFEIINADKFTETFINTFYLKYLNSWADLCWAAVAADSTVLGYVIGLSNYY